MATVRNLWILLIAATVLLGSAGCNDANNRFVFDAAVDAGGADRSSQTAGLDAGAAEAHAASADGGAE